MMEETAEGSNYGETIMNNACTEMYFDSFLTLCIYKYRICVEEDSFPS